MVVRSGEVDFDPQALLVCKLVMCVKKIDFSPASLAGIGRLACGLEKVSRKR